MTRRISIASTHRVIDSRDPYKVITTDAAAFFGTLHDGPGEVVCVTLDDGREVLTMRRHLTEVQP